MQVNTWHVLMHLRQLFWSYFWRINNKRFTQLKHTWLATKKRKTFIFSLRLLFSFPERVVYHKAIQMYKTCCGDAHDYLKNDFVFASEIHSRLLRSSSNLQLYTPRPNTELFRNSFIFSGTSIWNSNTLKLHLLWIILNLCI